MSKDLEQIKKTCEDQQKKLDELELKNKSLEDEKAKMVANMKGLHAGVRYDSIEQKALHYFRAQNVKDLMEVNTESDYARDCIPSEVRGYVRELKKTVDIARWMKQIFHNGSLDSKRENVVPVHGILDTHYGKQVLVPHLKALGSTVVGEGAEYVPTLVSSQFIEEYNLERKVAQLVEEIKMPSNPYNLPVEASTPEATVIAEGAQATSTNLTTSSLVLSAKKTVQYTILPEELNEDSAVAILARCRQILVKAQIDAMEQCIINGDDSATHMDADTHAGAAGLAAKAFKGLRKRALANSATIDFAGAAIASAKIDQMIALMGKFGVNVRELAFICNPAGYQQLKTLDEVNTVDKFGPQATILSGALAAIYGIPIVVSEYVRTGLNDDGVQDGVTETKTVLHLFNKMRFYLGMRRPIQSRIMMDMADYDRWLMASYCRWTFNGLTQSASEKSTVLGIDILT